MVTVVKKRCCNHYKHLAAKIGLAVYLMWRWIDAISITRSCLWATFLTLGSIAAYREKKAIFCVHIRSSVSIQTETILPLWWRGHVCVCEQCACVSGWEISGQTCLLKPPDGRGENKKFPPWLKRGRQGQLQDWPCQGQRASHACSMP